MFWMYVFLCFDAIEKLSAIYIIMMLAHFCSFFFNVSETTFEKFSCVKKKEKCAKDLTKKITSRLSINAKKKKKNQPSKFKYVCVKNKYRNKFQLDHRNINK